MAFGDCRQTRNYCDSRRLRLCLPKEPHPDDEIKSFIREANVGKLFTTWVRRWYSLLCHRFDDKHDK